MEYRFTYLNSCRMVTPRPEGRIFNFMIIDFLYTIGQMVFYAEGYHIKHGHILAVKHDQINWYLIEGVWCPERLVNPVHKELITSLFHRPNTSA